MEHYQSKLLGGEFLDGILLVYATVLGGNFGNQKALRLCCLMLVQMASAVSSVWKQGPG